MTYSIPGPWHRSGDVYEHDAIPGITIRNAYGRYAIESDRVHVILLCDFLRDAQRIVEAIALAGAEGLPR